MKVNTLVNIKLTQESGQTSMPPWKYEKGSFSNMIYLKEESIFNNEILKDSYLNGLPVLLKVYQDENDFNNFDYTSQLPKKLENDEILSKKDVKNIDRAVYEKLKWTFDLDFDLNGFYDFLSGDEKLVDSIEFCRGLRLFLASDPFECLISSICSANNSIARWTKSVDRMKDIWGEKIEFESGTFKSFPKASEFKGFYKTPMEEAEADGHAMELECYTYNLKSCGVGYRADYMIKASEIFSDEHDLSDIFKMDYDEAFELILKTPGVGPKVADCILLYGFNFKEAFPSDVWIKRIVSHLYFDGEDISANKAREFGMDYFGDYAGYAQLYLFHYARKSGLMDKLNK